MRFYYKASFQYDGTGYYGFQWQKDLVTIQSEINRALGQLVPGQVTTMGSSRTDTGVHAFQQFVKITLDSEVECSSFQMKLNNILPPQIRCLDLEPCEGSFRPNDVKTKEYRYLFTNKLQDNCTGRRFIANNPYPLNIEAMNICVRALKGVHNFQNFVSTGSNVKSTVREILFIELSEVDPRDFFSTSEVFRLPEDLDRCFQLRVVGKGFLKQMIRHLMTALWKVGNGRLSPEDFLSLLEGPKREGRSWKVAHPKGLFLYEITY